MHLLRQPCKRGSGCSFLTSRNLGQLLKRHQLFVNLLKLLKGGVLSYGELADAFARSMPAANAAHVNLVLDALLVMVAWALREGDQPLVTLRLQLWLRELRRMVGKLSADREEVCLRSERDLPSERDGVYLPLVQCNQCRTTGWLSRLVQGSSKPSTQLDEIYNTWFSRRPEVARLYAAESIGRSHVEGISQQVCVACGNVQQGVWHVGTRCCCQYFELLRNVPRSSARPSTPGMTIPVLAVANGENCDCLVRELPRWVPR
jgi:DEAD/DEAH box helicase domain-containing protein